MKHTYIRKKHPNFKRNTIINSHSKNKIIQQSLCRLCMSFFCKQINSNLNNNDFVFQLNDRKSASVKEPPKEPPALPSREVKTGRNSLYVAFGQDLP